MLITILRSYKDSATPGTLLINGDRFCYTLERARMGDSPCIPEGEYMLALTYSERFKRLLPQIMSVPGRTGIRLHNGNFTKDSSGCVLVGYESGLDPYGVPCVYKSKDCLNELMMYLAKAQAEQVLAIEVKSW